jgi:hypothetical protein
MSEEALAESRLEVQISILRRDLGLFEPSALLELWEET